MIEIPNDRVEQYVSVASTLLPECSRESKHIVIAYADDGNHFLDFGITKGTTLFFDQELSFEDDHPSLFFSADKNELRVLRNPKVGYEYAGRLVATLHQFPV